MALPLDIERHLIDYGLEADEPVGLEDIADELGLLADEGLDLPWPAGLKPQPQPWNAADRPSDDDRLLQADVLVVTWTVAEWRALADVLTPGFPSKIWQFYSRGFETLYKPQIRAGAPSLANGRLGAYFRTRIGAKSVVCFKSELHLNQDGRPTGPGKATLPVADLFRQLIKEVKPKLVITVGTAGATFPPKKTTTIGGKPCSPHQLGDVVVTRAAKFRLQQEFAQEDFADKAYRCDTFAIPEDRLDAAKTLLAKYAHMLTEPDFGPPHAGYAWPENQVAPGVVNVPDLKIDGRDFPEFHPILTTDFFEFGTSRNGLEKIGCGVEMGDAVLGMVAEEMKAAGEAAPDWLVIRNASDPQINGALPNRDTPGVPTSLRRALDMQAHWAVWYYETYGYWTSVNSAIAVWAMAV
jgi:hypothetical protein